MYQEFIQVYDQVSRLGFPALFVVGQIRGWWFIKPYVDLLVTRIGEITSDLNAAREAGERATGIAEQSHLIAKQALEQSAKNHTLVVENNGLLAQVLAGQRQMQLDLARLTGRTEG